MRNRSRRVIMLGVTAAVIAACLTVATTAGQQTSSTKPFPPYKAPRLADGRPDLNGLWQALVTANIDLEDHEAQPGPHPELLGAYGGWPAGQSIVEGGEIPYQTSALAKRQRNLENRMKVDVSNDKTWHDLGDPEFKCYMPGVPRATYMPFPFQIVQGSSPYILIAYEFTSATRTIRASEDASCCTMRKSRSGFAPGASRSISLSTVSGKTFFSRNARVRKIITVSETIEQASNGHMKIPPLVKNPATVWKAFNI